MLRRSTLQDFIDDELLRAPMNFDRVVDAVQQQWRLRLAPAPRGSADPVRLLQQNRGELVAAALRALRLAVQAATGDEAPAPWGHDAAQGSAGGELSLIDEDDVAIDIEIARAVQMARQLAEAELRELHTYTSALVADVNVARDTNPFTPERYVRALWQGVQQLPLSRPMWLSFMTEGALPMAQVLRLAFSAASQRLQGQGVQPASHRTILHAPSPGWSAERSRSLTPMDLAALRGSLGAQPPAPARPVAAAGPDPQLIALLARLFTAIQLDRDLGPGTVDLLQRLQPTVLRLALHDSSPLDTYEHPVWRFMDQLAHDLTHAAPAQAPRLTGLCRNLVDHLGGIEAPEASHFQWAFERLLAARKHALAQAQAAAGPRIARLERVARHQASAASATMPLDIDSLDTVPADLMPERDPGAGPAQGAALAQATTPGAELRVYLQGEWRHLLTLWQDDEQELVLLQAPATEQHFALRQAALARLMDEGLARPLRRRSLVRRAANQVLHGG